MIALYRMGHQGRTLERAYAEMLAYDFYARNGHKGFKTYVEQFSARLAASPEAALAAVHPPQAAST